MALLAVPLLAACLLPALAEASRVTVPANVGVGPAGFMPFGLVFQDQPVHPGLRIWIGAVIDKETIRRNINRVPARYRRQARQIDELRYRAHILIPDSLILSPNIAGTGIVGATWRPISLGIPLVRSDGFNVGLSAGAILSYAFIWSDTLPVRFTNFLRPGVDVKLEAELRLHERLYASFGWVSQIHLPQELGPNPFVMDQAFVDEIPSSLSRAIWHIGQPFVMLHYRFPYEVTL